MRKMPIFRPLTAHFGGSRGVFSYETDKSAIFCPGKTEVADFVRLRVQSFQDVEHCVQKITCKFSSVFMFRYELLDIFQ